MARLIRIAACPRCRYDVRADALQVVPAGWVSGTLAGAEEWLQRVAAGASEVRVCTDCHEDLRQLSLEERYWSREAQAYGK